MLIIEEIYDKKVLFDGIFYWANSIVCRDISWDISFTFSVCLIKDITKKALASGSCKGNHMDGLAQVKLG